MSAMYKLSATLEQHGADVRCVSSSNPEVSKDCRGDIVLTGSRDRRAIIWNRSNGNQFTSALELGNHEGFVNACALLRSDSPYAITAGQDKIIYAYQLLASEGQISVQLDPKTSESQPTRTLIGHTENVCALDVEQHGKYIVSGSWDKTAKVWRNWECVATFKGHEQSVWAVLAVDHDRVLTASADKTIKLWSISSPSKPIAVFGGHTDAVRGLTLLEGGESFASCGNDGNIHLYSLHEASSSGSATIQPVQVLSGHTSFVYSLATILGGKGELVSSGEDRSVRVWRDGALVQTITLPAISVWSVSVLPNGDIVAGSSDAAARVFTRDASLVADDEALKAYDRAISTQTLNQTQVGDIKKDDLPGPEALSQPGSKEGQTKMVKNADVVEAYQWSAASQQWVKIGEVVGGVGSGSKKLYEGKEYDYVFDVDIADGVPPLKLPFNLSENPYAAAQRFLEKNDLPQQYIDQVVQFIDKNTSGVNLGAPQFADPYTGASRYQPSGSSSAAPAAAAPSSAPQSNIASHDGSIYTGARNVDPYTSSAAPTSASASAAAPAASPSRILPQRAFLAFRSANFSAIKNKLLQVNQQESVQLSAAEMGQIDQLISQLEGGSSGGLNIDALRRAVSSWSAGSCLPALDLIRCAAALGTTSAPLEIARDVFGASAWAEDWPAPGSSEAKIRDVNSMLALRTIANLWNDKRAIGELEVNGVSLLGSLSDAHYARLSKNGRIAFATVVYNSTAQMVAGMAKNTAAGITLGLINEVLGHEQEDSEALYRILVAFGNLLCSSSGSSLNRNALDTAIQSIQRVATSSFGKEQRIAQIATEINSLL
ncbi:related to DOA1 - involved in ubiquitin-dependent proteolysis [Melanopsichium pennsylvanicum]|uniref:Related to DOA1 - involved in ubiquitin-dependent proteolysis n=2 Tax=Melanopsichium pennsylvanicum TaxID=63383 RepID=A0AAJ4XMK5_9BASI|nr:related to DOA1-involved in ubiquitin-dependent proteolysis [Melanopsichium pennsylvanicum 4]SNX84918.1 related to DOA1 - involved in ubiquitin-dependent proteolysis [Melanopsichium pennsylvanicum]